MKKLLIAANWKMNKTCEETEIFLTKLITLNELARCEVIVAPPFTALSTARTLIKNSPIKLAAQNCYHEVSGAFTGEISPVMLKELGCIYSLVGHSERRHVFKELDESIHKKIQLLLKNNIKPLFCVGETLEQRDRNQTESVLLSQLTAGLKGLSAFDMRNIVIAYEPVWAIGTGLNATPAQAQSVHTFIRKLLKDTYGFECAKEIRLLYGGSVKAENACELTEEKDIDGLLIGGASLKAESFIEIIYQCEKNKGGVN